MASQVTAQEDDVRLKMLNTFMTCPHRDTDKVLEVHKELQAKDPVFYAHLACWYLKHGEIRDMQEIFSAALSCDPYLENREVGIALWQQHRPTLKSKILGFIHGKTVKISTKTGKMIKIGGKEVEQRVTTEKKVGLNRSVPTSFRNEVEKYLRWLESDADRFDTVALSNADELKSLYLVTGKRHGIKPSARAQQILFDKKYPPDSKLTVFKKIVTAKTPEEQATMIVENKIPYPIAVGLVEKITPSILVALVNAMSPQEVINNVASLQDKGAYDNPDLKRMIEAKLVKASTSKSVSTLKSKTAKNTGRVQDESIKQKLDEVADKQVKRTGAIKMSTAIFVDKSGSMNKAIEVGKRVASLVSGALEAVMHVVAFDSAAREIHAEGTTLTAWENAFKPVKADGQTSMGVALDYLIRANWPVEQIVIITDEGENQAPRFADVFPKYVAKFGSTPRVIVIHLKSDDGSENFVLTQTLKLRSIEFEVFTPKDADYYSLPGLIPFLSRHSKLDLIYEIMDTPLVKRKAYKIGEAVPAYKEPTRKIAWTEPVTE